MPLGGCGVLLEVGSVLVEEATGLRIIRLSFSLLFVDAWSSSDKSRDKKVCNKCSSMMLTGVKVDEVGDAATEEPDTLDVGDILPASACEIVLVSTELQYVSVRDERRS